MKDIKSLKNELVFPYRNSDLVSETDFVNYCLGRGILVDLHELQMYRENNLLTQVKVTNKKHLYSVYQIYPLKHIQDSLRKIIPAYAVQFTDNDWKELQQEFNRNYIANIKQIKDAVRNYYYDFNFYIKLLEISIGVIDKAENVYRDSVINELDTIENFRDLNHALKYRDREARKQVVVLMDRQKLKVDDLLSMQRKYTDLGASVDPSRNLYPSMLAIPYLERIKCTGLLKYAQDCYAISENIGWCIDLLGNDSLDITAELTGNSSFRICPYCNEKYTPIRPNVQTSCGKDACKNAHRNYQRREKYKSLR